MKRMLLVDGNSIMNNCFFGMPLLSTDDGVYTNAVVGTVNVLIKYLNELHPDYCAVAFDVHEPTFRHKAYAEYKAGRHRMPEELVPQFRSSRNASRRSESGSSRHRGMRQTIFSERARRGQEMKRMHI